MSQQQILEISLDNGRMESVIVPKNLKIVIRDYDFFHGDASIKQDEQGHYYSEMVLGSGHHECI